ncbi:hypothetical protein CyaNS01_02460 [Cyanobium sp. NS01]|nr:hypothetical protein CyaNS01_02460 [Cyanobium sp. NS01]
MFMCCTPEAEAEAGRLTEMEERLRERPFGAVGFCGRCEATATESFWKREWR